MKTKHRIEKLRTWGPLCFLHVICTVLAITSTIHAEAQQLIVTTVEGNLALHETITVKVDKLSEWIKTKGNDASKFILYIDGIPLKDLQLGVVGNNTELQFDLKRNDKNKAGWNTLLSRKRTEFFTREVSVTIGFDNGSQIPTSFKGDLIIINEFWFKVFAGFFAVTISVFLWLVHSSDIIRDPGPQPGGTNQRGEVNRKPYSLARTQMALWFFVVIISYVFIWMVNGDLSNLTPSVLGLIGISAATGLSAAVIDSNKRSDQDIQRQTIEEKKRNHELEAEKLKSEIVMLNTTINAAPPPANLAEQKATLAVKEAELIAKEKEIADAVQRTQELAQLGKPPVSKRFIDDILSDDNGVSFHRFQIFTWTVVLIFIFIASVSDTLTMPDFDATLLGLMGLSGGTYIGFKVPKRQS